ncbi:hypothetical protein [Halobacillus seohaensis]|uniref:Uncharacterized protein n=1 Tax=Halobacillus seohaensis TaxID=447421 RepID=A0ABW2EL01_9BACI
MDFEHVMNQLNNAKLAVERAQEDQTGFVEAQSQVKIAEEELSKAKHDPSVNTEANAQQIQRATDLLRLIEETHHANNQ